MKKTPLLNRLTPYMFVLPAVAVMVIALFYPLVYMIYGSFRQWDPSQAISETDFIGFKNYTTLFYDPNFAESLSVTLKFAFSVVTVEMFLGGWSCFVVGSQPAWFVGA